MIAATLFSGIGAPEVAMPHWHWAWHAEIERFPNAVMKEQHPRSHNLGDVTNGDFIERAEDITRPDVLVFGSPCQSFSVAGKRVGLDDPRGNLAIVALGIVARLKPRWFVFENVPGLLSSSEGRDFGLFLRTVDELGYFGAWASLDAQWFGVAQRRERLFFVGNSRDWRYSAAVLFESEGLFGHSPPRRQAGQRPAPTIASRPTGGGGLGTDFDCDGGLIAGAPKLIGSFQQNSMDGRGTLGWNDDGEAPLRPIKPQSDHPFIAFDARMRARGHDGSHANAGGQVAVAFHENQRAETTTSETAGSLKVGEGKPGQGYPAVAVALRGREGGATAEVSEAPSALRASNGGGDTAHVMTSAVRRLTPRECERLQGFPDDYTLVNYRGKPAADGPRYKALGNSMAVPVLRWILSRIELVDGVNLCAATVTQT